VGKGEGAQESAVGRRGVPHFGSAQKFLPRISRPFMIQSTPSGAMQKSRLAGATCSSMKDVATRVEIVSIPFKLEIPAQNQLNRPPTLVDSIMIHQLIEKTSYMGWRHTRRNDGVSFLVIGLWSYPDGFPYCANSVELLVTNSGERLHGT